MVDGIGPRITVPKQFILFLRSITLFLLNLMYDPSSFLNSFLDLISIDLHFVFFVSQLLGIVFLTLTLAKPPVFEVRLL